MESETDDNCYERKDIPVDSFGGDFYHSRDVTTRQLNRNLLTHGGSDLSPAAAAAALGRPISLPAKLPNPDGGAAGNGRDQLDSGDCSTLIRRYAEVTKFKQETTSGNSANNGNRLSKGPPESSLALAKKRLSALHTSVQQHEVETMDDDMMPLLSSNRELSQEELYESHTSLVSSSEGGIMAEGEETSSDESQESNSSANHTAIVMSLLERLLRSHPVWFLPGIQRSGAIHLLQGKEEGTFIVRGSSQSKTMAVSVRLPANAGPYIEHYLIQSNNGQLSLESSRFKFDSIPALIAHYTQCCDELPVQLCLPVALREAKNRQQLSSLALLGQEFWRYPMASSPKPKPITGPAPPGTTPSATSSHMNTPSEATHSSGLGISVLNHTPVGHAASVGTGGTSLGTGGMVNAFGETPTDTFSTLSSFTVSNGQTLLSPESIDSAIMMSPMDPHQHQTGIIGKTSTFKARKQQIVSPTAAQHEVEKQIELFNANILGHSSGAGHSNGEATGGEMTSSTSSSMESRPDDALNATGTLERKPRAPRPTPPNTLNIKPIRSPPAPPARRIKLQIAEHSPTVERTTFTFQKDTDFTPTTGFPTRDTSFQRREPAVLPASISTIAGSQVSNTVWYCDSDNVADNGVEKQATTQSNDQHQEHDHPSFSVPTSTRVSRRNKRKESKHYQESDILESPSVYCRSTLVDKISDYEDIWSQDATKSDRRSLLGQRHGIFGHEDLTLKGLVSPSIESMSYRQGKLTSYRGPAAHGAHTYSVDNLAVGMGGHDSASDRASTPTDRHGARPPVALKTFSPIPKDDGRFGRSVLTDVRQRSCMNISHTTPVGTPVTLEDALGGAGQEQKQTSPFYADPADILSTIIRRSPLNRLASSNSSQRHSEPPKQLFGNDDALPSAGHPWGNGNGYNVNNNFAASLDELALEKNDSMLSGVRMHALSIAGGSSGQGTNDYDSDIRWKTPTASLKTIEPAAKSLQKSTDSLMGMGRPVTIHQIIAKKLPALKLSERLLEGLLANDSGIGANGESGFGTLGHRGQRKSAYDNVEKQANAYASSAINSAHSDDGTVFSEPWDSSQWDSFLPNERKWCLVSVRGSANLAVTVTVFAESSMEAPGNSSYDHCGSTAKDTRYRKDGQQHQLPQSQQKVATILRSRSCRDREILCHPRNRSSHSGPGESIATYAFYLANKPDSTFSRNISNFIACTKESKAAPHPQVVMRNMRQFMSGMKNYLVKHGEGDFAGEVQKARAQLKPDEFLNLDSILEEVMHRLVILPLREHLYSLFVDYYSQSGDIQLIVEKVRSTAGRGPLAFGIKGNVIPPSPTAMRQIATLFVRLQEAELPLAKLDLLLAAVSTIFEATTCCNGQQLSADDFLPVLVMVVAHCGFIGAEIEAEYMWGLLQPSLLSGEAGYYLTALCSAVHVLKNFSLSEQEGTSTLDWDSSTMPNCSSVLRVIIPDEYNGSIQTRTLPIRPHTTTKEVCRIIAHKARITNAQDYGLFKLIDGEETLLHDTECPQDVRMTAKGKHFMIAYKRIDAKIAWPTVMPNNAASNNNTMTASTTNNAANNAINTITTTTTTITASDNHLKV
ncbi:protein sprint isoform X1 [Anopheles arabiensis]|uniref:protein sprint isoform X1 n=1 Tax=Anopheles arabiensis TaxID=7173 RepID=UPI001AAD8CE0|nr:protein sprint isoform X1 [Anopheles arabiensis]